MSSTADVTRQSQGKVRIVGGYGKVGWAIAERLTSRFPDRLIIAGRSVDKVSACAAETCIQSMGNSI